MHDERASDENMVGEMSMTISFFVEGDPKPQPRPRAFARRFKGGKIAARVYDSGTAEGWKSAIAMAARDKRPQTPLDCPIHLEVEFLFRRPASHYGTGKNQRKLKGSAPLSHTCKPDLDNLIKAVKDCLTTLQFWHDDAQVMKEIVSKRWKLPEHRSGAMISITQAEGY